MADKTKNIDVDNNNKLKAIREMQEKNRMRSDNTSVNKPVVKIKSIDQLKADAIANAPYPKGTLSGQDSAAFDEGMDRPSKGGYAGISQNKNFNLGVKAAAKINNQGKTKKSNG